MVCPPPTLHLPTSTPSIVDRSRGAEEEEEKGGGVKAERIEEAGLGDCTKNDDSSSSRLLQSQCHRGCYCPTTVPGICNFASMLTSIVSCSYYSSPQFCFFHSPRPGGMRAAIKLITPVPLRIYLLREGDHLPPHDLARH